MNMFYPIVLWIHNAVRWFILILGIIALIRAYYGWFGKRDWSMIDRKVGIFFTSTLDLQLLLGLLLYFFLSPITKSAFKDFGGGMSNPQARFFILEHALYMVVAVVLAHIGSALAKRADQALIRHRRTALWFSLSLLAILVGMPWARPLLPGF